MPFAKTTASLLATITSISYVAAHGVVNGIVANGVYFRGYQPGFQFQNPPPTVAGWSIPKDLDNGFISPGSFSNPDIICHKGATPGQAYVTVSAGGTIRLRWTKWPATHHGPVIDYLANCNGECTTVDKTTLKFNKIDAQGRISSSPSPGTWASDKLIAANNTWTMHIPSSVAPGKYVLRHEIIALHSAEKADGAQSYPQCINLKITGSGTDALASGTVGTQLYTARDAGILVNIYQGLTSYLVPGPAVHQAGSSGSTPASPPSSPKIPAPPFSAIPNARVAGAASAVARALSSASAPPSTKPLPPGTTLDDLLAWLQIIRTRMFRADQSSGVHARAVGGF